MARKFKLYDRAPERPNKCIVTGLAGPVVDLEKHVENYGRVYLHVSVVAAMAEKFGFLNDKESAALRQQLTEARAEADRYPAVMEVFADDVRDALDRARVRAAGGRDSLGRGDGPAVEDDADVAGGADVDGDAAGAVDGPASGEDAGRLREDADGPFDQPAVFSE